MTSTNAKRSIVPEKKISESGNIVFFFLLMISVFVFYGNSIRNGYNLDDEFVTNGNPRVSQGFKGIPEIFAGKYSEREDHVYGYRPIVVMTFAIEYEFFGFNPTVSHLINLLLYYLISFLIYALIKILVKNINLLFAFIVALLFIMHPVHTEVVNSLKNRDELLSLIFSLTAWMTIIWFVDKRRIIYLFFGIICFFLAILSKPNALVFVLIIPFSLLFFRTSIISGGESENIIDGKVKLPFIERRLMLMIISAIIFILGFYFNCLVYAGYIPSLENVSRLLTLFIFLIAMFMVHYSLWIMFSKKYPERFEKYKAKRLQYLLFLLVIILCITIIVLRGNKGWATFLAIIISFLPWSFIFFSFKELKDYVKSIRIPRWMIATLIGSLIIGLLVTFLIIIPTTFTDTGENSVELWQNPLYFKNGFFSRIPLAFYSLLYYIKLLIFPHPLGFYYGYDMLPMNTLGIILGFLGFLVFCLLLLLVFLFSKKRPVFGFAILYFIISVFMFSNLLVPVAGIIGERLIFGASLGYCMLLGLLIFRIAGISRFCTRISKKSRAIVFILLVIIGIPFLIKTFTRNKDWKDRKTLFLADIGYLSNSVKANDLTAAMLFQETVTQYKNNPAEPAVLNKLRLVIKHYIRAADIYPDHYMALNNVGIVYLNYLGKPDSARYYFEECVKVKPDFREGQLNLSTAYDRCTKPLEAISAFQKALEISPGDAAMISYMAVLYFKAGYKEKAIQLNDSLIKAEPNFDVPFINAGNFAIADGDTVTAGYYWEKAFLINSSNKELCQSLSNLFETTGNKDKAAYYRSQAQSLISGKH